MRNDDAELIEATRLLLESITAMEAGLEKFGLAVLTAMDAFRDIPPEELDPEEVLEMISRLGDGMIKQVSTQRRMAEHCKTASQLFLTYLELQG